MKQALTVKKPEDYLQRLIYVLSGGDTAILLHALLSALAAALLAYHYLVIFGYGNPDAVSEGLLMYTGYDWALACGRWAIRYMSAGLSGNVVLPGLWVPLYALCCALSATLISRLWNIESKISVCLISFLLTVNPTVIEQSLLQYMFMAWGISNCLCVMFVYFNCSDDNIYRRLFLYPLFVAVAFGLYQACLGLLCVMFCMTLVLRLLNGEKIESVLRLIFKFAISLIIGVAFYFAILRFELKHWGVEESGRVLAFSVKEIFASLGASFPAAYKSFFAYFFERSFHRSLLYKMFFAFGGAFILYHAIQVLERKYYIETAAALLLALLIPACANVSDIVFPYNKPVLIMQYQSMIVVPFVLALIPRMEVGRIPLANLSRLCAYFVLVAIAWGYTVSANATYKVYERTYDYTHSVIASALDRVYMLPDYYEGETIAFAGFPDDAVLREGGANAYAYGQYNNLIFWDGFMGLEGCRRNYILHFFGIDAGNIPYEQYINALNSQEFKEMNIFPLENSVRRIDGLIMIKFDDEFEIYG